MTETTMILYSRDGQTVRDPVCRVRERRGSIDGLLGLIGRRWCTVAIVDGRLVETWEHYSGIGRLG